MIGFFRYALSWVLVLCILNINNAFGMYDEPDHTERGSRRVAWIKQLSGVGEPQDQPGIEDNKTLVRSWVSDAAINIIAASETILANWSLSRISPIEIATNELIHSSQNFLTILSVSPLGAIEDLTADQRGEYLRLKKSGAVDEAEASLSNIGRILRAAGVLGVILSLPTALVSRTIAPIMISQGYNEELYSQLDTYYGFFAYGMPMRTLCFLNMYFSICTENYKVTTAISCLSAFTCILNYAFIRHPSFFGFSDVFQGVAAASLCETILTFGAYLGAYKYLRSFQPYEIFATDFSTSDLSKLIKQGWPLLAKSIVNTITTTIIIQFVIPDTSRGLVLGSAPHGLDRFRPEIRDLV